MSPANETRAGWPPLPRPIHHHPNRHPHLGQSHEKGFAVNGSRRKRIAAGSGTTVQEVNNLLKQHAQMSKMMKMMGSGGGMQKVQQRLMSQMGGMQKFGR